MKFGTRKIELSPAGDHPRRSVFLATAVFSVALVFGAIVSYQNARRLAATENSIHISCTRIVELQGTRAAITSAESASRGFILTGEPAYLRRYKQSVAEAKLHQARVSQFISDHSEQQAELQELDKVFSERVKLLDAVVESRALGTPVPAPLYAESAIAYGETIRRMVDEMTTREDAVVKAKSIKAEHSARIAIIAVIVGASSDLLLLALLSYFLLRGSEHRKAADAALRKSEELYRNLYEQTVLGLFSATLDGRFLSVNPALARITGYHSPAEMVSSVSDIGTQLYVDPTLRLELIQQLKRERFVHNFECEWCRKDGTRIWILETARLEQDSVSGFVYHGTIEDITERKLLEQQLRQAQKMEAVGRLAGGVAHDFNNALGVITGYTDLIRNTLAASDQHCKYLEEISKAAHRASALTRQLLAFSRRQVIHPQVIDLNSIVCDAEKMLRRLIGEHIELVVACDPNLGPIKADVGQIDQVLLNLVVNARDAMAKGGKIFVKTSNAELDDTYAHEHPGAKPGSYVMLSVTDTGCGMDKETIAHIFEPFFTTKEPGKGTGLGLSTVYGIAKQNSGYISTANPPREPHSKYFFRALKALPNL